MLDTTTLDVRQPRVRSLEGFESYAAREVGKGNTILQSIFERTDHCPCEPKSELHRLIATVRWIELQLTRAEFSQETGINTRGVRIMEDPDFGDEGSQPRSTMTRVLDYWEQHGIAFGIRNQLLQLLEKKHGGGTMGFYRKLAYEIGPDVFDTTTELTPTILSHRKIISTVPPYLEVFSTVQQLYRGRGKNQTALRNLRASEGKDAWISEKEAQLQKRELEECYRDLLINLEVYMAEQRGHLLTTDNVRKEMGKGHNLPAETARNLLNGVWMPWDSVRDTVHLVVPDAERASIQREWDALWEREQSRVTFADTWHRHREMQNISGVDLIYAAGITDSHVRGTNAIDLGDRVGGFHAYEVIRHVIEEGRVNDQISARALVALVTESKEEAEALKKQYYANKKRFHTRSGHLARGERLDLRIWRHYNGVSQDALARYMLPDANEQEILTYRSRLSNIETHVIPDDALEPGELKKIRAAITSIGDQTVCDALSRRRWQSIPTHCTAFRSVSDVITLLAEAHRGKSNLIDALRQNGASWSNKYLSKVGAGSVCPDFPKIKKIITTFDLEVPEAVERDWYVRYADQLSTQYARALPRLLMTLIHYHEPSVRDFQRERCSDVSDSAHVQVISGLEAGQWPAWHPRVTRILSAAEITRDSVIWRFAEHLYHHDDHIEKALESVAAQMKREQKDLHPIHLPGITLAELDAISLES